MPIQLESYAIVSLQDAKDYLNLPAGDNTADDLLAASINRISSMIESEVRGYVKQRTVSDEVLNGDGTSVIRVRNRPIYELKTPAVTDLLYRVSPESTTWNTLEADINRILFDEDAPTKIILWGNTFPIGDQNVKVSYKAGYKTIPGAVAQVCIEAVAEIYAESGSSGTNRLGMASKSTGTSGVSATTSYFQLADRHRKMLAPFVWRFA